jgi:hypothetical protein
MSPNDISEEGNLSNSFPSVTNSICSHASNCKTVTVCEHLGHMLKIEVM